MRVEQEFNIQFCQVVQGYPLLYDSTGYCNRKIQDQTWALVAEKVEAIVEDCKERWKNIRNRYTKYKKACSLPSGSSGRPKKEYYLAPHLGFLDDYLKPRSYDSSVNSAKTINTESEDDATDSPNLAKQLAMRSQSKSPTSNDLLGESEGLPDPDLSFLKSLLPDMKCMTPAQKRKFKMGIINLAGAILENPNPSISSKSRCFNENSTNRTLSRECDSNDSNYILSTPLKKKPYKMDAKLPPAVEQIEIDP